VYEEGLEERKEVFILYDLVIARVHMYVRDAIFDKGQESQKHEVRSHGEILLRF
jgi:hypothetical protein